jgi:hypothetical protein
MAVNRYYSSTAVDTTLLGDGVGGAFTNASTTIKLSDSSGFPLSYPFTLAVGFDLSTEELINIVGAGTVAHTFKIGVTPGVESIDGRGIDDTPVAGHDAGVAVKHVFSARDMAEAQEHIANVTNPHGISSVTDLVYGTDTNWITTGMIQNSAIATAKINDVAVTTAKIADSAVTSAKIADGTIATGDIADSAVTTAKVNDGAITSAKIADATIATGDLADGAVTSAKIANGTIVTADLADASVTEAKIVDSSITSAKIADGAIVDADVNAAAAIAQSKIAGLTTALGLKAPLADPTFTGTVVFPSTTSIGTVSNTEIGYLDGVTSSIQTQLDNRAFKPTTGVAAAYGTDTNLGTTATTLDTFDLVLTEQCSVAIISTIMVNVSASANSAYFGTAVTGATSGAYASSAVVGNVNGQTSVTVVRLITLSAGTNHIYIQGYRTGTGTWTAQNVASIALPIKAFA